MRKLLTLLLLMCLGLCGLASCLEVDHTGTPDTVVVEKDKQPDVVVDTQPAPDVNVHVDNGGSDKGSDDDSGSK